MAAPMNMTLYRLLVKTGATEADAEVAARIDTADVVTKADLSAFATKADIAGLKAEILELETRLQRFMLQGFLGMTTVFAIIVGLFRVFAAR